MLDSYVGELRMHIRTDLPEPDAVRPAAERAVAAVLERCAGLLEQRAPGRIVLLQRLPLRWQLDAAALADAGQIEAMAEAVADQIERILPPTRLEPADIGMAQFDDEAHWRASQLLAVARGRPAWFLQALEHSGEAEPLAALAAPQRREVAFAALARLAREAVLAEALAAQPAAAVAVLAAAWGCGALPPPAMAGGAAAGPVAAAALPITRLAAQLAASAAGWPALSVPARQLALRVQAAVLLDADLDAAETLALAAAAQAMPAAPGRDVERPQPAMWQQVSVGGQPAVADAAVEPAWSVGLDEAAPIAEFDEFPTACAGLFYLLERIQELDIAESLWQACLPEGAVLAAALAALAGPDGAADVAAALCGGLNARPLPDYGAVCRRLDVGLEQLGEVALTTLTALAAALPRRGLAALPPVRLARAGRLLIAQAMGSPFALFAWPGARAADLQAGLCEFLQVWPLRAGVYASPELAGLDRSGQVQALAADHPGGLPVAPLLPPAPSPEAAALLALVAGAPCALLAARTAAPVPDTAAAFAARHLLRPARIRLAQERMDIVLPAEALDFDLRRAGLDRDPGWVPWLRRNVRFVFESPKTADIVSAGGAWP